MKTNPLLALTSAVVLLFNPALPVSAQLPVTPDETVYQPLSDQQLDQLLAPIALYPDPLLAEILAAATLPGQIVLADRYLGGGGDPSQTGSLTWDASVQALVHFPNILRYLDDNLAWTTQVGEAFMYQQPEVMQSIQRLRMSARNFGNLVSTAQQQVVDDGGDIEILPAQPEMIYVPVYQPDYVYDQSGYGLSFGASWAMGPWLNCDFDWLHNQLHYWHHHHPRPDNWWRLPASQRASLLAGQTAVWQPRAGRGAVIGAGNRGGNHAGGQAATTHGAGTSRPGNSESAFQPGNPARPGGAAGPAGARETGGLHLPDRPAPGLEPSAAGGYASHGGNTPAVRTVPNYSRPAAPSFTQSETTRPETRPVEPARIEPAHSAPTHTEPAHTEPAHVEPAHVEPPAAHAAPAAESGGNAHDSSSRR